MSQKKMIIDSSNSFFNLTKINEGIELHAYECIRGYLTIGRGHNIDANGMPKNLVRLMEHDGRDWRKDGITPMIADMIFELDAKTALDACNRLYKRYSDLSQYRQIVLFDMAFQMGETSLRGFSNMNKAVNSDHFSEVPFHMLESDYAKITPERAGRNAIFWSLDQVFGV